MTQTVQVQTNQPSVHNLYAYIEELKAKITELEEEKTTDESILLAIGDGLIVVDMNMRIIMVNTAFETMLEWTMEEVLGKQFGDVIIKQDEAGNQISIEQRYQTINSSSAEQTIKDNFYYVRKSGSRFPVSITTAPIVEGDKQIGIVQIFRDITEEKSLEKSKNEFVSIASHQLRTPISLINWYTEMLSGDQSANINEEQKEYIKEITKAGNRMTNIVNSLLNISRLELGTFDIESKRINVKNLYQKVLPNFSVMAQGKQIQLLSEFSDNISEINISPNALEVIFEVLLLNAVKYTPEKGQVKTRITQFENYIQISVSDNGYGIPPEEQSKVFKKLFRGTNIMKIDTDGTGVGLFIVKKIVDLIHGKIGFVSELNKGSQFVVNLPFS